MLLLLPPLLLLRVLNGTGAMLADGDGDMDPTPLLLPVLELLMELPPVSMLPLPLLLLPVLNGSGPMLAAPKPHHASFTHGTGVLCWSTPDSLIAAGNLQMYSLERPPTLWVQDTTVHHLVAPASFTTPRGTDLGSPRTCITASEPPPNTTASAAGCTCISRGGATASPRSAVACGWLSPTTSRGHKENSTREGKHERVHERPKK